jgi:hypothetical protein
MAEDAAPEGGDMPGDESQSETASLPISMWGGKPVKEGDTFQVKVISVDHRGGVVNVAMAGYGSAPQKPGSDGLAEQIDKPKQEGEV